MHEEKRLISQMLQMVHLSLLSPMVVAMLYNIKSSK